MYISQQEMDTFFLEPQKDKQFYMIDMDWDEAIIPNDFGSKFAVNIEDGKKKSVEVKELQTTRRKLETINNKRNHG